MKLKFYRPNHRSLTFSLLLLVVYTLLLLTGLGVFRLYFAFDWTVSEHTGQLFALRIRGGQSLNLFEAQPFGRIFWISQVCLMLLCVFMPLFRIAGGLILALVAGVAIIALHYQIPRDPVAQGLSGTPLEFELMTIAVLVAVYVLLIYIGDRRDQVKIARLLHKFVPEELSERYQRNPDALSLAGEEREISVLFCDVIDFSSVARELDSTRLATWLNFYFSYISKIVVRYRGSIDKYMGDSVMAVWGAPVISQTHAFDALRAALDIQNEIVELNATYRGAGLPGISVGIGISTGPAMVGPLGSEYRMDYTVIGDTVNVAQRLEVQTRKYHVPVIVGDTTAEVANGLLFRELDTVNVGGRVDDVTMYQPLCAEADASAELIEKLDKHEQAMAASAAQRWDEAHALFSELRETWGPEQMYDLYLWGIELVRD